MKTCKKVYWTQLWSILYSGIVPVCMCECVCRGYSGLSLPRISALPSTSTLLGGIASRIARFGVLLHFLSNGWLVGRFVSWLIACIVDCSFNWLFDCLFDWFIDWLIDWLFVYLFDWLFYRLSACYVVDWSIGWSVDWLLFDWLINCLIDRLFKYHSLFIDYLP